MGVEVGLGQFVTKPWGFAARGRGIRGMSDEGSNKRGYGVIGRQYDRPSI